MKNSYNKNLKLLARDLRKDGTKGEVMLWKYVLRARQVHGYAFNLYLSPRATFRR